MLLLQDALSGPRLSGLAGSPPSACCCTHSSTVRTPAPVESMLRSKLLLNKSSSFAGLATVSSRGVGCEGTRADATCAVDAAEQEQSSTAAIVNIVKDNKFIYAAIWIPATGIKALNQLPSSSTADIVHTLARLPIVAYIYSALSTLEHICKMRYSSGPQWVESCMSVWAGGGRVASCLVVQTRDRDDGTREPMKRCGNAVGHPTLT